MNKSHIMAKIKRNCDMLGIAATTDLNSVTVDSVVVSYVEAAIQKPMGGIDGSVSPFLGMGIVNPGVLSIKGAAGENTVGAIMSSATRMKIFALLAGFANDIALVAGDSTTELARIQGHVDMIGVGQ